MRMRRIYAISSRSPLLEPPKGVNVLFPSFTVADSVWITLVSVPSDRNWDNFRLMESFAHEGCYASQFLTFGTV